MWRGLHGSRNCPRGNARKRFGRWRDRARSTPLSACSKRGCSPLYRAHQGRTELQAPCRLRPERQALVLLLTEGQMSDHKGACLLCDALLPGKASPAEHGYCVDQFKCCDQHIPILRRLVYASVRLSCAMRVSVLIVPE